MGFALGPVRKDVDHTVSAVVEHACVLLAIIASPMRTVRPSAQAMLNAVLLAHVVLSLGHVSVM